MGDNGFHESLAIAAQGMEGRGYNLVIVIVSRHAQPLTIYNKITYFLSRMTTLELYFNMRVRNFIKEMAVDNISTMIVRQWQATVHYPQSDHIPRCPSLGSH